MWFAPRGVCREICTNFGARGSQAAITWSTDIRAWATKSPADWARRWLRRGVKCTFWSGDGSYLMMAQEIVTSIQEGYKLNIVLLDNHGFSSIGGLSRACGNEGMGTDYRYRRGEKYDGDILPVDFAANAASLGAWTTRARTAEELKAALVAGRKQDRTSVVVIETSYDQRVPGYESWWDVPIAEVSERDAVKAARKDYEERRKKERFFF